MLSTILIFALALQAEEPKPQEPPLPGEAPADDQANCEAHPDGWWEVCDTPVMEPPPAPVAPEIPPLPGDDVDIPLDALIIDSSTEDVLREAEALIRAIDAERARDRRCAERARLESLLEQKSAEIDELAEALDDLFPSQGAAALARRLAPYLAERRVLERELQAAAERYREASGPNGLRVDLASAQARLREVYYRLHGLDDMIETARNAHSVGRANYRHFRAELRAKTEERIDIGRQLERARRQCQSLGD